MAAARLRLTPCSLSPHPRAALRASIACLAAQRPRAAVAAAAAAGHGFASRQCTPFSIQARVSHRGACIWLRDARPPVPIYIYAPIQPAAVLPTCVQTASLRARSSKWPLASGTLLSPTPSPLDAPNAARRPAAAGDRGACNGESKRQSMDARLLLHAQKVQCFKTRASDLEFNTIVQSEWGDRGAKGRLVYVSARDGACIFWMPRCASPAPGAKKGGFGDGAIGLSRAVLQGRKSGVKLSGVAFTVGKDGARGVGDSGIGGGGVQRSEGAACSREKTADQRWGPQRSKEKLMMRERPKATRRARGRVCVYAFKRGACMDGGRRCGRGRGGGGWGGGAGAEIVRALQHSQQKKRRAGGKGAISQQTGADVVAGDHARRRSG